jgi:hypothetical protein
MLLSSRECQFIRDGNIPFGGTNRVTGDHAARLAGARHAANSISAR